MALIRWGRDDEWFGQVDKIRREMETALSTFRPFFETSASRGYHTSVYPPVNVYGDNESYIVHAEVPGVDPKTLEVDVTGDTLSIRGERREPELGKGASYHRCERSFGTFRRSLTLPDRVDSSKVLAECHDGILEVRLPFAEEAKSRKVAVKINT